MGAQGTSTLDFGAFPGSFDAVVVITGQAGIVAGSLVEAWIRPVATAVHSVDEHYMIASMIDVLAGEIVAGTGLTIRGIARDLGGEALAPPGEPDRFMNPNVTAGNNQAFGDPTWSVGGKALNRIWGTVTVAWVWN